MPNWENGPLDTFNEEVGKPYPPLFVKEICRPEGIKTLNMEASLKEGFPSTFLPFLNEYDYYCLESFRQNHIENNLSTHFEPTSVVHRQDKLKIQSSLAC